MATRSWEFQDDQLRKHVVAFDHGRWSRWQTVTVDGKVAVRERRGFDARGSHQFTFDGHVGQVRVRTEGLGYAYDLDVDGQRVQQRGTRLSTANDSTSLPQQPTPAPAMRFAPALSWLYWIAGATIVNAVLYHMGSSVAFPVGASFGFLIEGVAEGLELLVGWVGHLLVAGLFYWIARRVRGGSEAALKSGIVLYSLDSVMDALIIFDPILVGLRVLAIWSLIRALRTPPQLASPTPAVSG